jgi:hypothetical protein
MGVASRQISGSWDLETGDSSSPPRDVGFEHADWPFGKTPFLFTCSPRTPEALQPIAPGWRVSAYPGMT